MKVLALAVVVVFSLAPACGSAGGSGGDPPPPPSDSGPPRDVDTGPADAGAIDGGTPEPSPDPFGLPLDETGGSTPGAFGNRDEDGLDDPSSTSCYDGDDNDGDGLVDCDDESCLGIGACCVGNGDCCGAATAPLPSSLSFTGCGTTAPASCLADRGIPAVAFGDPTPWIRDDALAPGGDDSFDSGLYIDQEVDLTTHRLSLGVTFSTAVDCGDGCLEGAAVSLSTQPTFDATTPVSTLVGLVLGGSRAQVSLVVGDAEVAGWSVEGQDSTTLGLVLRPTGELTVTKDGEPVHQGRFLPARGTRLVLHGRNENPAPDSPRGALVDSVTVRDQLCDIPDSWTARAPLELRAGSTGVIEVQDASTPSLAYDGEGRAVVAFESGGELFLGQRPGADQTELTLPGTLDNPALSPGTGFDRDGLSDPEVVWVPTEGLVTLYTGWSGGVGRIGRAVAASVSSGLVRGDGPVLDPDTDPRIQSFEQPTVAVHPTRGTWILVVRARLASGGTELLVFLSDDAGQTFRPLVDADLDEAFGAGDPDEVAHPSLVVHNRAYQLYAARRKGTRWSVVAATSREMVRFRALLDGGAALAPDQGPDRIGVTAPDVAARGTTLEMAYEGRDGTRPTLMYAQREATDFGLP